MVRWSSSPYMWFGDTWIYIDNKISYHDDSVNYFGVGTTFGSGKMGAWINPEVSYEN